MNFVEAVVARLADGPAYVIAPLPVGQRALVRRILDLMPEREAGADAADCARAHIRLEASNGPPFRWPHHTVSQAGMAGGPILSKGTDGPRWLPGEVHLACGGLLVLDECNERSLHSLAATSDEVARLEPELRPWVLLLDTVESRRVDVRRLNRSLAMLHGFRAEPFAPTEAEWRTALLTLAR